MFGVCCHLGEGCVMSRTNVVDSEGAVEAFTSDEVPDFMTLPGSHMAAECPSRNSGSIVVQVCVVRSRTRVGDRKSTRLNSSHSQISYAVFCLKKKKITAIKSILRS